MAVVLANGCGSSEADVAAVAGQTALEYYKYLLTDEYDSFVAGMADADSLPSAYREQMVANAAMFKKQQNDEHQGIANIELGHCEAVNDTSTTTAQAYLIMSFGDKTTETVCVPMVRRNGNWYMK